MAIMRTEAAARPEPSLRVQAPKSEEKESRLGSAKVPEKPSENDSPKRQSRGEIDTRA